MTRSIFLFFCISEIATAKSLSPQSQEGSFQSLPQILLESDPNPEGSASASEIVSGAIRDNNRGKLVGKKTFGKGLVQSMRTLVDGSGLTVTVAKYLTPNGTDINKFGITPDIEVKMNSNPILQREIGTKRDRQYRAGEKELLKIIKKTKLVSQFQPDSANVLAFFKNNENNFVYSLN